MKLNIVVEDYSHYYIENVTRWYLFKNEENEIYINVFCGRDKNIGFVLCKDIELSGDNTMFKSFVRATNLMLEQERACVSINVPELIKEAKILKEVCDGE